VLDRVRKFDRELFKRDLHRISHAATWTEARGAARRLFQRWKRSLPGAGPLPGPGPRYLA